MTSPVHTLSQRSISLGTVLLFMGFVCVSFFLSFQTAQAQIPLKVQMFFEADSYTHPFYQGKSLPVATGNVSIFAIPSEAVGNPDRASYTWKMNNTVLGSKSGVGRSSLAVTGSPFIDDVRIAVNVVGENGVEELGTFSVPFVKPEVLLYKNLPLSGVDFGNAIHNTLRAEVGSDLSVIAYPFFFSQKSTAMTYAWKVDGLQKTTKDAVLTATGETSGTSTVNVSIQNPYSILERASKMVSVVLQ